jgi:GNAT superfamily N-acetyltransferase
MRTAESAQFRKAKPTEGGLLTELALRSKAHWPYSEDYLKKCRGPLTVDAESIATSQVYVMERQGRILGFHSLFHKEEKTWLENIWLEPDSIGKGFGKALFEHAASVAKGLGWIPFLIVVDPFAMKFYMKMGCKHVGFQESQVYKNLYLPLLEFREGAM